jgi:AcrR family transcriptional regulator
MPPERLTLLRRIVGILSSQETPDWSLALLSSALDISKEELRREFGTEQGLLAAAREMLSEVVLAALTEPLRTAETGREALHVMLENTISLRRAYRRLQTQRVAGRALPFEHNLDAEIIENCGRMLEYHIQDRFERSVYEGELPEGANVRSMSTLTLTVVNGLLFYPQENAPVSTLLESAQIFVDGLGFQPVRPAKRRPRRLAPVLPFVQRVAW